MLLLSRGVKMRVVYNLPNSEENQDEEDEVPAVLALSTTASSAGPSTSTSAAVTIAKTPSSLRAGSTKKNQDKSLSSKSRSRRGSNSCKASKSINRRADAIKNWLVGVGCASELKIRETVGDTPDTSKALRLLVKREEVKRTGAGGRLDPFMYMDIGREIMW